MQRIASKWSLQQKRQQQPALGRPLGASHKDLDEQIKRKAAHERRRGVLCCAPLPLVPRTAQPWWVLHPRAPAMRRWDTLIFVGLLYVAFVTPYEFCVLRERRPPGGLHALNVAINIFFSVDIAVNLLVLAYYDEKHNGWVVDPAFIARRYARGWMVIDILSVIPWDELHSGLRALRLLRILRLSKLLKVQKLNAIFRRLNEALGMRYAYMTLVQYLALAVMLTHWWACLWAALPAFVNVTMRGYPDCTGHHDAGCERWSADWGPTWLDGVPEASTAGEQYLTALEFALFAMVMGYGKAKPANPIEQVFALVACVVLGCLYAYCIGSVCSLVSALDPPSAEFRSAMDELNIFLNELENDVSPARLDAMRRFMTHRQPHFRERHRANVVKLLSPALRADVARATLSAYARRPLSCESATPSERERFVCERAAARREGLTPSENVRRGDLATEPTSCAAGCGFSAAPSSRRAATRRRRRRRRAPRPRRARAHAARHARARSN